MPKHPLLRSAFLSGQIIGFLCRRPHAVLVIHNHPSGQAVPSEADRRITQRLAEAGRIIQINLIDHLIVGTNSCFSFREAGLL